MWTLIMWSLLCSAVDANCPMGDYWVKDRTYTHIKLCTQAGEIWHRLDKKNNRYYCGWTETVERFGI